ncbi:MAG: putative Holliday junction resolvase [Actinomycetota bacterium]|jgi:putative Holliday junction resolvase
MRPGRRLAFDHGSARIGVASSTVDAIFASPVAVIPTNEQALSRCQEIIEELSPIEIYVGLPLNLHGEFTKSTESALAFAGQLAELVEVPVLMVDERMTTRAAQAQLHASGKNTKSSKGIIDAAAATLILESALASEQASGNVRAKSLEEFDV